MASDADLEEALHTCINGLLASQPPSLAALSAAADRLLGEVIEPLKESAEELQPSDHHCPN